MKIAVFTSYFYHSVKEVQKIVLFLERRKVFSGVVLFIAEFRICADGYQSLNQTIIDGDKSVRVKTGNIQKIIKVFL